MAPVYARTSRCRDARKTRFRPARYGFGRVRLSLTSHRQLLRTHCVKFSKLVMARVRRFIQVTSAQNHSVKSVDAPPRFPGEGRLDGQRRQFLGGQSAVSLVHRLGGAYETPARTRITAVFSMPSLSAIASAVLKP